MTRPTIALCIPAYNAASYLPRLLRSAARQVVPFDEVLVYDDCSTDDTADLAKAAGATVVRGDVNRGCSFGKNRLAEVATSEWIHFHDADDELCDNFVNVALRWASRSDAPDVVLFAYEYRDDDTNELIGIRRFDPDALRADPIAYTIREQVNPFCGLYRRSSFLSAGGYDLDPQVLYNEDVAFHCHLARMGLRFDADDRVTLINYRRGSSMSRANGAKCIRAHYHVLRKALALSDARYHPIIASKLWQAAGIAAGFADWETADTAAELAGRVGGTNAAGRSWVFRELCRLHPSLALRLRELAIRALKPRMRPHLGRRTFSLSR
jgi:glycosyltransferase involved in cell wall biosynthesis